MKEKSITVTLVASLVLSTLFAPTMTSAGIANTPAITNKDADAIDQAIELFVTVLDRASKHPVGQIGGLLLRGYAAYKQWKNGREIADLREAAYDMLKEITGLIERIERGESVSEAQWTLVRERLDNHAARIAGIESRLDRLERQVGETKRGLEEIIPKVTRKPCPEFHKPVGPERVCVDVRTLTRSELSCR